MFTFAELGFGKRDGHLTISGESAGEGLVWEIHTLVLQILTGRVSL